MTSLRAAFQRLTRPNALTYLGLSDADRQTLDIAASAAKREFRRTSTPIFDEVRADRGDPRPVKSVDQLAMERDLLALVLATGTLVGPVEGGAA